MKLERSGELYELLVEPTPQAIHDAYLDGMRVINGGLDYPRQMWDLYRLNGYAMAPVMCPSRSERPELGLQQFIDRHGSLKERGALVGPTIMIRSLEVIEVLEEAMSLWLPERFLRYRAGEVL